MAICPKCNATIGQTDVRCPECGYDFPDHPRNVPRTGLAYSAIADIALIVGGIAAGVGCIRAIIAAIVATMNQRWWDAFFVAPVSFFLCLAMLIVFIRIQNA